MIIVNINKLVPAGFLRFYLLRELKGKPMHGYELMKRIEERTYWKPTPGAVYPALHSLEEEGLIKKTGEEGRKIVYDLTQSGEKALEESKVEFEKSEEHLVNLLSNILGLGLGEIFKGIGGFIKLIGKMVEAEEGTRAIYGYNVRVKERGKPIVEKFGTFRQTEQGPVIEKKREPIVDVFEGDDCVSVIAELPGIEENDLNLGLTDDKLTISASTPKREYHKEIRLPHPVKKEISKTMKNGVLEIKLGKKDDTR